MPYKNLESPLFPGNPRVNKSVLNRGSMYVAPINTTSGKKLYNTLQRLDEMGLLKPGMNAKKTYIALRNEHNTGVSSMKNVGRNTTRRRRR